MVADHLLPRKGLRYRRQYRRSHAAQCPPGPWTAAGPGLGATDRNAARAVSADVDLGDTMAGSESAAPFCVGSTLPDTIELLGWLINQLGCPPIQGPVRSANVTTLRHGIVSIWGETAFGQQALVVMLASLGLPESRL
jgi:hypothetical protein